ncbi:putative (di)nucleoside polyphosphatehydrolase [Monoraphidium neglectum]|uniref:Putative (Di)nucleoside polyphosphatehydrolase n=1 Tax=Monoraphidium neglectum TaxID=145388 RepID=A0A0D2JXG8_9CHLO|nr:putative (di)nucleoside polyphosphatehydrolase [Monoraphidium neglectum]KIZ03328.1 putative (di)nucleoside polyphosphatehydrolase [Monoraphidium neglectum]|eukprot:XP_013902347.1 putative (di)nucleoside polyphosphatehydrolase [Monoraphidium neglectum]
MNARWGKVWYRKGAELVLPDELRDFRPNVGICVVNKKGLVFAARRLDDPFPDSWQMPQGGIDPGEAPLEAAVRELKEEVSISSVRLVAQLDDWVAYEFPTEVRSRFTGAWARYRGQAQRWFLFAFTGDDAEVDLETEHREFKDWQWMPLAELPSRVISFKREVYERVAAELGPHIERLKAEGGLGG